MSKRCPECDYSTPTLTVGLRCPYMACPGRIVKDDYCYWCGKVECDEPEACASALDWERQHG